ncbi:MAG: helix-turn-helix transcriptional regulator [Bdellovibrionaceae bacterium]|nr:helix-turn-helix transcriptional regulator [Bdellovibrionales bacterium]MCB9084045.1 helix-turn-helix transcriptional regulator [Pseudobdellovibrionaceae bacterium]
MACEIDGEFGLSSKLALLAGMMKISQVEMANRCGLSRITVNRFFRGRTQIKASDLMELMDVLGIDLEQLVDRRIGEVMEGGPETNEDVFVDVARVLAGLDSQVKRTLLEQIHWWGRSAIEKSTRGAAERIQSYLQGVQA